MKRQAPPVAAPGVQVAALFDTHDEQGWRAADSLQAHPEGMTYDQLKAAAKLGCPRKVVSHMINEMGFELTRTRAPGLDQFGVYRKGITRVKLIRWPAPKAQKELPL